MSKQAKIGTGVFIINDNKILIGKRSNTSLGEGKYGLPGGHLDFGETIKDCGSRETHEETGVVVNNVDINILGFVENIDQTKHYVTFFMSTNKYKGSVTNPEPEKHNKWEWKTVDEMRELNNEIFGPLKSFLEKYPDFDPSKL